MTGMDFRGRVFLAPLTKGGNLPFRRLCVAHGCRVTMGEMAYAYQVVRGSRSELALLRKHADEACFGVQIAASRPADAVRAGVAAAERGTGVVDLQRGVPSKGVSTAAARSTTSCAAAWARRCCRSPSDSAASSPRWSRASRCP